MAKHKGSSYYYTSSVYWPLLGPIWLINLVLSIIVWKNQYISDVFINFIEKTEILELYPALNTELSQYISLSHDENKAKVVAIIFSMQVFSLIIVTIVHVSFIFANSIKSNMDTYKFWLALMICIGGLYVLGDISRHQSDLYKDYRCIWFIYCKKDIDDCNIVIFNSSVCR